MNGCAFQWLRTGDETFAAMLAAIAAARESVRFETYTFAVSALGERFLAALRDAARRGVEVRVLVDAFGSLNLPDVFWQPLRAAGGVCRWFNPLTLRRLTFRNHRKLLVCDDATAFVGGFNLAPEYEGDGVTRGWRDVGLCVGGELAATLAGSFDDLFDRHDLQHPPLTRLRPSTARRSVACATGEVLLTGPGRGVNEFKQGLLRDLASARRVQIAAAYFLPIGRVRRALLRACRRGADVELVLPGRSDVALAQHASRAQYRRLLRAGAKVFEYGPQVLHSKLILVDDAAYIGSSNLDPRSLHINYELMLRVTDVRAVAEARAIFADHRQHSRAIELRSWIAGRTWWTRLQGRWACFVLGRLDRLLMARQLKPALEAAADGHPPSL
jgi:cardiolipin synthase